MEVRGLEAMYAEAVHFVATLARNEDGATVVVLSGDLGAGKTTFTQGIARGLGIEENVTSPTFVLEKIYELEHQKWLHLIHIDAYRLKDARELEVLGWNEIVFDPSNLIVVEWPEHIATLIPARAIRVTLEGVGDSREVKLYG